MVSAPAFASAGRCPHNAGRRQDDQNGVLVQIGSSLRQARERQGLALVDVERATHVRGRYLRALEEERLDLLPPGYERVLLRDYASFLGLDPQPLLDDLPEPEPEIAPRPEPPPLRPLPLRAIGFVAASLALVGLVAVALAFRPGGHATRAVPPAVVKPKPAPAPVRVVRHKRTPAVAVLTAAGGDCWILAKRGDKVVWQGTLRQGSTLRFSVAQRLWLRLGAPWNLTLRVGGRPIAGLPTTAATVLLSRAGLAAA